MIVTHKAKALDKILEAQAAAGAAGKVRVTKRFVPGAKFNKAVTNAAPVMFSALNELKADPGFSGLSEETREKLAALLEQLEAAKVENVELKADAGAVADESKAA